LSASWRPNGRSRISANRRPMIPAPISPMAAPPAAPHRAERRCRRNRPRACPSAADIPTCVAAPTIKLGRPGGTSVAIALVARRPYRQVPRMPSRRRR
jgi:hypothetical protein